MGFIIYSIGALLTVTWSAKQFDDSDMWLSVMPLITIFWPLIAVPALVISVYRRIA